MEKTKLLLEPISNGKAVLLEDYVYSINGYDITIFKGLLDKSTQIFYNGWGISASFFTVVI